MAVMPLKVWHQVSCDSLRSALERSDVKKEGDERDDSGKKSRAKAIGRPLLILISRTGCWGKADDAGMSSQKSSNSGCTECPGMQKDSLLYSEDLC